MTWLSYLLMLFCGPLGMGPLLSCTRWWVLASLGQIALLGVLYTYFKGPWWNTLIYTMGYYFLITLFYRYFYKTPSSAKITSSFRQTFQLAFPGFALLFFLSFPLTGIFRLTSDYLWSGFLETHFSWNHTVIQVGLTWLALLAALFTQYYFNCKNKNLYSSSFAYYFINISLLLFLQYQLYQGLLLVPLRQTLSAGIYPGWFSSSVHVIFIIYVLGSLPLLGNALQSVAFFSLKQIKIVIACVLLGISLLLTWGSGTYISFMTARELEKQGRLDLCIPLYQKTLRLSSSDSLRSYFQYQLGLLYRKKGQNNQARQAFARVVLKENKNFALVLNSKKFLQALKTSTKGERIVVPGMEMRTEYKSAYCVPNSLGFVMGYFGNKVAAKEIGKAITTLEQGSFIPDAVSYAEQKEFNFVLWPLAKPQELKSLIRAGMPVLVFTPGHVLVVFGFDEVLKTFVTYDVATFEIWDERDENSLIKEWNRSQNLMAVVYPKSQSNKWQAHLPVHWKEKSERYLQFELAQVRDIPFVWKEDHYKASFYPGFYLSNWQWSFARLQPRPLHLDTAQAGALLSSSGLTPADRYYYVQSLYRSGYDSLLINYSQKMGERVTLTREERYIRAAAHFRQKDLTSALHQIFAESTEDLPGMVLAFLFTYIKAYPETAFPLARQLLELTPDQLVSTEVSSEAYRYIRLKKSASLSVDNNLALDRVYRYLVTWNPYDTLALGDMDSLVQLSNKNLDDTWQKSLWQERWLRFKGYQADWYH